MALKKALVPLFLSCKAKNVTSKTSKFVWEKSKRVSLENLDVGEKGFFLIFILFYFWGGHAPLLHKPLCKFRNF